MTEYKNENLLHITRFSLGAEEYALVLSMVGKPQDGQIVLAAAHKDMDNVDSEALLSSASHSLLARNFCSLPPDGGQPVIEKNLRKAIDCLLVYDQVLYLNVITKDNPIQLMMHINSQKEFCAHLNKANLVHLLEYGQHKELCDYLINSLEEVTVPNNSVADLFEAKVTLGALSNLLQTQGENVELTKKFIDNNWSSERINMLLEDLGSQVVRGTILLVQTDNVESLEKYEKAPKNTLLFLRGHKRVWIFQFPSADDSTMGTARIIDRQGFYNAVTSLVKSTSME